MAVSTHKVILFSRIKDGNKTVQWPTAVFNSHEDARSYATILSMAHKSSDVEMATKLDARTSKTEDGKLVAGLRFSIVEVPYAPKASLGVTDMLDEPAVPAVPSGGLS